jgi:hypothetical protein
MPKPRRPWTVTPHEPLVQHEENFWSVEGMVPGAPIRRRMCIVRRSDGDLLFFHAVPLAEPALAQVLALGKPRYLVVGHHQHATDAHGFSERLGVKIFGPKLDDPGLRARCDPAGSFADVPPDPSFTLESLPGSKLGEALMVVNSGEHKSALFCDAIQNNPPEQTVLPFRLLGFAGGPKMPPIYRWMYLEDRAAMRAAFERLAALPGLQRLVPCHGRIVATDAAQSLRAVAQAL